MVSSREWHSTREYPGPNIIFDINDLPSVCRTQCPNTKILLYADDAKIYNVVTSDEDQKSLQRVVDNVKEWCDQWLLSLNVTKCYHMSYSSRQSIDLHLQLHLFRSKTITIQ